MEDNNTTKSHAGETWPGEHRRFTWGLTLQGFDRFKEITKILRASIEGEAFGQRQEIEDALREFWRSAHRLHMTLLRHKVLGYPDGEAGRVASCYCCHELGLDRVDHLEIPGIPAID